MTEPDYTQYSIEQLRDALAHINKASYPERFTRLQRELESRQELENAVEPIAESREVVAVNNWLSKAVTQVAKTAPFISLAIVANALLEALSEWSIPQLGFQLTLRVARDSLDTNRAVALVLFWVLIALFAVGGASAFIKQKVPNRCLFLVWVLVSFQFMFGSLVWFPSFSGWMSYHLKYQSLSGGKITFAIHVVLVPLFLAAATGWGEFAEPHESGTAPNLGVPADRNPRERGFRPLNTDR